MKLIERGAKAETEGKMTGYLMDDPDPEVLPDEFPPEEVLIQRLVWLESYYAIREIEIMEDIKAKAFEAIEDIREQQYHSRLDQSAWYPGEP